MTSPSLIKQGKEWGYGLNSQDPLISFSKKKKKNDIPSHSFKV